MNESPGIIGKEKDPENPFTQQQVEDFVLLAGQSGERWFKLVFIDEDMAKDPTAIALMESIADVIQAGVMSIAFEERTNQAKKDFPEIVESIIEKP